LLPFLFVERQIDIFYDCVAFNVLRKHVLPGRRYG
jgi:hypothetical protein